MTSRIRSPVTDTDTELYQRLDGDGIRHFIMVAGAGSGKTTSLVKALAHIEKSQGKYLRRHGKQIACITYTEVAVKEIRSDVGNDPLFHVSTIHSFLWSVIKPFQSDLRQWVRDRLNSKIQEEQERIDKPRTRQTTKDHAAVNIERYQQQLQEITQVKSFKYGTGSDYTNGVLGHSDILNIGPAFIQEHALMRSVVTRCFRIIFVDESQDTDPSFVEALRTIAREAQDSFCLGFFGDPVQKIYPQGMGRIPAEDGWQILEKPDNFRCPQSIMKVINRIRAEDDGLWQTGGRQEMLDGEWVPVEGTARVLVLPADERRQERLQGARQWLAEQNGDDGWLEDEDEEVLRLLVLVHRMAATRLGFPNLYSALNDRAPEDLKGGLIDGTAWVLRPFLYFVLPLLLARQEDGDFEIMRLLRRQCPLLQRDQLAGQNTAAVLNALQEDIGTLGGLLDPESDSTIGDAVTLLRDRHLIALDERFPGLIDGYAAGEAVAEPAPENAALRFMQCHARELWGYRRYIEKLSPFATQQGIKGAEFSKVLVVVDDEEGKSPTFSYGKYFGVTPLSDRDQENIAEGRDSVVDRTRRLFYVCCSRALSDLSVIVFAQDTAQMQQALLDKAFFEAGNVYVLE